MTKFSLTGKLLDPRGEPLQGKLVIRVASEYWRNTSTGEVTSASIDVPLQPNGSVSVDLEQTTDFSYELRFEEVFSKNGQRANLPCTRFNLTRPTTIATILAGSKSSPEARAFSGLQVDPADPGAFLLP